MTELSNHFYVELGLLAALSVAIIGVLIGILLAERDEEFDDFDDEIDGRWETTEDARVVHCTTSETADEAYERGYDDGVKATIADAVATLEASEVNAELWAAAEEFGRGLSAPVSVPASLREIDQ